MSSISPVTFNAFSTQQSIPNPTVSSGVSAGAVFNGRGNDFLDPSDILRNVNNFSGTVSPGSGGSLIDQLISSNVIPQNATPTMVVTNTTRTINQIFSPTFGANLLTPGQVSVNNPANFNPLTWDNPDPLNIMLGTLDAASKIGGGTGLFPTNNLPASGLGIGSGAPVTAPNPFLGSSILGPVVNANNPGFFPTPVGIGTNGFLPVTNPNAAIAQLNLLILQLQSIQKTLQDQLPTLQKNLAAANKLDQTGKEDKAFALAQIQKAQNALDQANQQIAEIQQRIQSLQFLQAQQLVALQQPPLIYPTQGNNPTNGLGGLPGGIPPYYGSIPAQTGSSTLAQSMMSMTIRQSVTFAQQVSMSNYANQIALMQMLQAQLESMNTEPAQSSTAPAASPPNGQNTTTPSPVISSGVSPAMGMPVMVMPVYGMMFMTA